MVTPSENLEEKKLSTEEQKEIEEAWGKEAERRLADYEAGNSKAIPADEAHQRIRAKLLS